jgi:hypothetical protein
MPWTAGPIMELVKSQTVTGGLSAHCTLKLGMGTAQPASLHIPASSPCPSGSQSLPLINCTSERGTVFVFTLKSHQQFTASNLPLPRVFLLRSQASAGRKGAWRLPSPCGAAEDRSAQHTLGQSNISSEPRSIDPGIFELWLGESSKENQNKVLLSLQQSFQLCPGWTRCWSFASLQRGSFPCQ